MNTEDLIERGLRSLYFQCPGCGSRHVKYIDVDYWHMKVARCQKCSGLWFKECGHCFGQSCFDCKIKEQKEKEQIEIMGPP